MPDYIFLLESRLSPEQRAVMVRVQELARTQGLNVYLTGGAVRDLISGMPLRDLDFTVEGNPARMIHELEKGGAKVTEANEHLRHFELIFAGDVEGSIAGARDEYYARPGAKPEMRWSTVMEDLQRRDFSINAVAISLNLASRGLLLDPTNGLADLERHEVRTLSIHSFTNQPVRLLRALRFCARLGFKLESRTQEWFDLAMERGLSETISGGDLGREVMDVAREQNPAVVLKAWESKGLLSVIHPRLQRRRPDYQGLSRLAKASDAFVSTGLRVRPAIPAIHYMFCKLKPREASSTFRNLDFSASEVEKILDFPREAKKLLQVLRGGKTKQPRAAYDVISKAPTELLAFTDAEFRNPRAAGKVRNYLHKWRPLRASLPVGLLDELGVPRGPKFDKVLEQLFDMQLRGKARPPQDVTKVLKRLAGIKDEVKKKVKEEKKQKKGKVADAAKQNPAVEGDAPAEKRVVGEAKPAASADSKARGQRAREARKSAVAAITKKAEARHKSRREKIRKRAHR
jgi:tRNA nucleotidyltransferase (CCA-adding enzyme)